MTSEVKISNITATAKFTDQLDLNQLARRLWNSEYNPKKFNALILRTRRPRVTALLFYTGKIVVVGAKSEQESIAGAEKVAKLLQRATRKEKKTIKVNDFRLQNIVASSQLNHRIQIDNLHAAKPGYVYYEPELFSPACKIKWTKGESLTALIFRSGKIIYTGTTDLAKINDFHSYLRQMLLKYRQHCIVYSNG
jgi:transcription initiation factor TFIID TATA-box-binding protein